jgi:hypothetical protein
METEKKVFRVADIRGGEEEFTHLFLSNNYELIN